MIEVLAEDIDRLGRKVERIKAPASPYSRRRIGYIKLTAASVEAVKRTPKGEIEVRDEAPAIIVHRSIGEAINRGDLRPGQKVPGKTSFS